MKVTDRRCRLGCSGQLVLDAGGNGSSDESARFSSSGAAQQTAILLGRVCQRTTKLLAVESNASKHDTCRNINDPSIGYLDLDTCTFVPEQGAGLSLVSFSCCDRAGPNFFSIERGEQRI